MHKCVTASDIHGLIRFHCECGYGLEDSDDYKLSTENWLEVTCLPCLKKIVLAEARTAPVRRSLPYIGIGYISARTDLTAEEKKALIDKRMEEALKEFSEEEARRREAFEQEKVLQKKARKRKKSK